MSHFITIFAPTWGIAFFPVLPPFMILRNKTIRISLLRRRRIARGSVPNATLEQCYYNVAHIYFREATRLSCRRKSAALMFRIILLFTLQLNTYNRQTLFIKPRYYIKININQTIVQARHTNK